MSISSLVSRRGVLAAAMLSTLVAVDVSAAPAIGQPAPAFKAVDSAGKPVTLEQYRGKTVVLEWTNHECPYVRKHYESGNMQSLQKEATGSGVVWLSIVSSAPGEQGYVKGPQADQLTKSRSAAPTSVLLDPAGTVGKLYDARTTPHMYVIDAAGKLVYMGGIDDKATSDKVDIKTAKNLVRAALADVAAGRAVATPVSRPYGCNVKYS
jgi:peroxiredoxin